jgi:hypothetical protein
MARCGLLYCAALEDDRLLLSVRDCLLRWYVELLSAKDSLKDICLGVIGDGLWGVLPACERLELSAAVAIGGRFSLADVRYPDSRDVW